MNNQSDLQGITEGLEGYRGSNPELTRLIDLYQEVFRIQEQTRLKARSAPGLGFDEAHRRLSSGNFILEGRAPSIGARLFKETALALGEVFSKASGCRFPAREILALHQLRPKATSNLASDILSNRVDYLKQFAKGTDFNEETVFLFLHSLVVPFFQAEAENYKDIIKESGWLKGICPFCGSPPRYARFLKEDGRRILFCPLCRSQWRFPVPAKVPREGECDRGMVGLHCTSDRQIVTAYIVWLRGTDTKAWPIFNQGIGTHP